MAIPVLVAIGASLANVIAVLREFRKAASFVIATVVWALFVWLIAWFYTRVDSVLSDVGQAVDGASVGVLSGVVAWFDKVEYMFPIYTVFSALGVYLSVSFSCIFIKWLMRVWDAVPFKGSASS